MLVYIMEETVIGEVQKILKEEHMYIQLLRKFARPRLTHMHTRRFAFAVGSLTGVLRRESLITTRPIAKLASCSFSFLLTYAW